MRTKTLLLTVALSATGVATSMAQVYSQNAVGYVNLQLFTGFNLYHNPLKQTDTTLETLIPSPPDGTVFYSYSFVGGYTLYEYNLAVFGGWDTPGGHFENGKGAFIKAPSPFTLTVVGEVPQGTLINPVEGPGFALKGSMVPQSGLLADDLKYTPIDGEVIYKFSNATGYKLFEYNVPVFGGWDPEQPSMGVGEGFFTSTPAAHPWTRVFTVN